MAGTGRRIDDLPEDDSCFETSPGATAVRSFDSLGLKSDLLRGIYRYGFEKPSDIQQRAAQPILAGRDVIAQAHSGTGKTAMIAFTMLQHVVTILRECQALILTPTRALAYQTEQIISEIGKDLGVIAHCCMGGSNLGDDIRRCERGVHIVSGTPGRVFDMIKRRSLRTRCIKTLVLEDADEMLAEGLKEQLYEVYRYLPPDIQVVLVSSIMPLDLLELGRKFMVDPVRVLAKRGELPIEGIKQFFVAVEREEWKFDTLTDLSDTLTITQAIIYVNTKRKAIWLTDRLRQSNFTVASMHDGTPLRETDAIMADFRAGGSRVLVTTDSVCRGLDVGRVALVINYDLPNNRELYLRRLSRAKGPGGKGVGINFVREDDVRVLRDIEQYYSSQIDEMPMNVADLIE